MKNKAITLLSALTLLSVTSFSQTVKENIDKQMKDPKTAENAAKADVYIQKKNADSILMQKTNQPVLSEKKNKKRKHCRKDNNAS
ncbi:MAG: hypothetical protein H0V14_07145 [Chitinophagaceae bacterium]|jgi:hypothetical protein|nr:hypothetical protein [Chitinophagaceae bacterium]